GLVVLRDDRIEVRIGPEAREREQVLDRWGLERLTVARIHAGRGRGVPGEAGLPGCLREGPAPVVRGVGFVLAVVEARAVPASACKEGHAVPEPQAVLREDGQV